MSSRTPPDPSCRRIAGLVADAVELDALNVFTNTAPDLVRRHQRALSTLRQGGHLLDRLKALTPETAEEARLVAELARWTQAVLNGWRVAGPCDGGPRLARHRRQLRAAAEAWASTLGGRS